MKVFIKHIISFLCFCYSVTAQPVAEVDQHLFSTAGQSYSVVGLEIYSFSIGEPIIFTYKSPDTSKYSFTQGYQQPIIRVPPPLKVTLTTYPITCKQAKNGYAVATVTGGISPYIYVWNGYNINNDTAVYTSAGTDSVTVKDQAGQIFKGEVTIVDDSKNCKPVFYTGFTPNNDNLNDTWVIKNIDLFNEVSVNIFNVWGNKVWGSGGYNNTSVVWKGTNEKGEELPPATYFYIAIINGETFKGWVELLR